MIEFNDNDYNLVKIRTDSKLFNLLTRNPYSVYGLKTPGNPLVHVSYNYDTVDESFDKRMLELTAFFTDNGMSFVSEAGGGTEKVCIGLRRDLRDHIVLTSSILQTVVYCLEGRLDLNKDMKIKNLPIFDK